MDDRVQVRKIFLDDCRSCPTMEGIANVIMAVGCFAWQCKKQRIIANPLRMESDLFEREAIFFWSGAGQAFNYICQGDQGSPYCEGSGVSKGLSGGIFSRTAIRWKTWLKTGEATTEPHLLVRGFSSQT